MPLSAIITTMLFGVNLLFYLSLLACVSQSSVHPPLTVEYSKTDFVEDSANDGSIKEKITVTSQTPWSLGTGTMTLNTHYTLSGNALPTGLSLVVSVSSDQVVTLELSGTATQHKWDHSVTGIAFSFKKDAFKSDQLPEDSSYKSTFAIYFVSYPITLYGTGPNADGNRSSRLVADLDCGIYRPNSVPHRNLRALLSFDNVDNLSTMSTLYEIPTSANIASVNETLIANNWISLLASGPLVSFSSAGVIASNSRWWHGTTYDGKNSTINCDEWTSNASNQYGLASQGSETSQWLSSGSSYNCQSLLEIVCVAY